MHKLEPLLRLPLALGLAHLLGRIPLPGSAPRREWVQAFAHPERDKRVAVGMVVLVALAAGHVAGLDRPAHPARRLRRDPAVLARHRRLARRTQQRRRPRAGGARRAVRHPGVGHQPRRTAAGARRQPVGCARLDSADPAGDHPRTRFGAAAVRRRAAVRRSGGYACPARYFVCRGAQRPRPRDVAVGATAAGAPGHRGIARARRRWRSSASPSAPARWPVSSPTAGCGRAIPAVEIYRVDGVAGGCIRTWPTPTRWRASTADPRRCCGSTSAAGCSASRRWGRCC